MSQLDSFEVIGSQRLHGEITPQGAKNEALQIISAVLLTAEPVTIHNIPNILDVNNLIKLLGEMGVEVLALGEGSYRFRAANINLDYLGSPEFRSRGAGLRGSIMILGPLLASSCAA